MSAFRAGKARVDREEAMMPGMSMVQCVEKRKIRGGRIPARDEAMSIRFLPYLSASIPPGSCNSSVEKDCSVARAPRILVVPPSSSM